MSKTKSLQEMEDSELMSKLDTLFEYLERQMGENALGSWTFKSLQDEIRRRIMSKCADGTTPTVTISFEKDKPEDIFLDTCYSAEPFLLHMKAGKRDVTIGLLNSHEMNLSRRLLGALKSVGMPIESFPDLPLPD